MKNILLLLVSILLLATTCQQKEDLCIAEVYNVRLYLSEVNFPDGVTPEDSVAWLNKYVEDWAKKQIMLHYADKSLSLNEKNFDREIEEYREKLMLETYFEKLSNNYNPKISDAELRSFLSQYGHGNAEQRGVVRVNYVKLPKNGTINKKVKSIFFDNDQRVLEKATIEELCADSVEYFLDDDAWLYLDYIVSEFPFEVENEDDIMQKYRNIDVYDDDYNYLVVFLDYRKHRPAAEREEELQIAKTLLMQQKKLEYINSVIDSLYQETANNNKIIL